MNSGLDDTLSIVIAAAGDGARLGLGPKALLPLGGRMLLEAVCTKARRIAGEVMVAAPASRMAEWQRHATGCAVIAGGESFLRTTASLAQAASRRKLLVWSVAAPFVSEPVLRRVAAGVPEGGVCAVLQPSDVPLAAMQDGAVREFLPRDAVMAVQGPQAYDRAALLDLIARATDADWQQQSFLQVALRHGQPVATVMGEKTNFKITTPDDWRLAQYLKDLL
ncbi:2-C-methyl-D-erythritol 4-phosphate cytidylyltransferase [Andreprevotia lacus DSM 23236]|jgi:2-C-methyl-D-erythritol 4-phosphate cytidylyltransferase|uniref:2-C-methyl-D-erythritol 4-phosphate cytidylyltransferase n=1 Tax=Andreprevotia lacus DSM 23236 TaxID=1121001 RepID=A0A1W1XLD3_9NEIS|nr:2-C-methyl-D-erythritol 4-phosphate cytidylyltransferase [Andreprevotia lacus]SMC24351.1 2-C-methyl-D-erythritol 4-phosphate cytidylyltransferase [Andreprevotia lacus DSM 23236]